MDAKKVLNQLLIERSTDKAELAEKVGIQAQSLRNRLNRNALTLANFQQMLEALDCHIEVVTNDTGKRYM